MTKYELKRNWLIYNSGIKSGELISINSLGIAVGKSQNLGLVNTSIRPEEKKQAQALVSRLLARWDEININSVTKGEEMSDEQKVFEICMKFIRQAEVGPVEGFQELLDSGVPVNFQHPRHKHTALHMAVAGNSNINHQILSMLLNSKQEIDFLIEDRIGRLPWHNAIFFGLDENLRDRVFERTQIAARKEGIDLRAEFQDKMKHWMHETWYLNIASYNQRHFEETPIEPS